MAFDPNQFLNMPADPMKTVYENINEGEYAFLIESVKFEEMKWNDKNTGEARSAPMMKLECVLLDSPGKGADEKARLGRDKLVVRCDIGLDLTPQGAFDFGVNKNVKLGQLRAAVKQNVPGWTSAQLVGAGPFVGKVRHRADKNDPTKKYPEIAQFAPIS